MHLSFASLSACVPDSCVQLSVLFFLTQKSTVSRKLFKESLFQKTKFLDRRYLEKVKITFCLTVYVLSLFILSLVEVSRAYAHIFVFWEGRFQHSGCNQQTLFCNTSKSQQDTMVKVSHSLQVPAFYYMGFPNKQFYTIMIVTHNCSS